MATQLQESTIENKLSGFGRSAVSQVTVKETKKVSCLSVPMICMSLATP